MTACVFASALFNLHIKDVYDGDAIKYVYHGDDTISLGQAAWEYVSYYKEYQCYPNDIVAVLPGTNEKID